MCTACLVTFISDSLFSCMATMHYSTFLSLDFCSLPLYFFTPLPFSALAPCSSFFGCSFKLLSRLTLPLLYFVPLCYPSLFNSLVRHLLFLYYLSFLCYWFPFSICPGLPLFVHPPLSFILCECCSYITLCPHNFFRHSVFCFTKLT